MNDERSFVAKHWHFSTNDEDIVVGLADHQDDPQRYLLLSRHLHPDAQDLRLGMAGVHIEIDDQACSGYGLVTRIALAKDRLLVRIEPPARSSDRIPRQISVDLGSLPIARSAVTDGLTALCRDTPIVLDLAPYDDSKADGRR